MNNAIRKIAVLFMVCGLAVSVSVAYELTEMEKSGVEYVKAVVAELERVKKQRYNNYIGDNGEHTLLSGKKFLEFVEKVKQNHNENCFYAVRYVMNDGDNWDKYHNYVWSDTSDRCMNLRPFAENVREIKKEFNKDGIKHNLP